MPHSPNSRIDPSAFDRSAERRQRNRMLLAVWLLLVAVAVVVYKGREVKTREAILPAARNIVPGAAVTDSARLSQATPGSTRPVPGAQNSTAVTTSGLESNPSQPATAAVPFSNPAPRRTLHPPTRPKVTANPATADDQAPENAPGVTATRAVLPPLRIEVVAGDRHSPVKPGNPSLKVDMQPGTPARSENESAPPTTEEEPAAAPLTEASERVQVSADTSQVLTHRVRPEYPLLARQMKVQGSVVLDAMIGKDGGIQDLHVVQGPTILADAAREAVRQWRFKPYLQDGQAVETQAHITVNFMISTN